jgi:hypothetical protein
LRCLGRGGWHRRCALGDRPAGPGRNDLGYVRCPEAKSRLSYPRRALIEAAIFGAACIALFAAELIVLAIAFLVVEAANTVIRSLLGQLDA